MVALQWKIHQWMMDYEVPHDIRKLWLHCRAPVFGDSSRPAEFSQFLVNFLPHLARSLAILRWVSPDTERIYIYMYNSKEFTSC